MYCYKSHRKQVCFITERQHEDCGLIRQMANKCLAAESISRDAQLLKHAGAGRLGTRVHFQHTEEKGRKKTARFWET